MGRRPGRVAGPPPAIFEINPGGAGDAALAGAVYALQGGLAAADCLRWAVAMGSAKASAEGSAMPPRVDVERIASCITLRRLA